jgi:hypothetical protein
MANVQRLSETFLISRWFCGVCGSGRNRSLFPTEMKSASGKTFANAFLFLH